MQLVSEQWALLRSRPTAKPAGAWPLQSVKTSHLHAQPEDQRRQQLRHASLVKVFCGGLGFGAAAFRRRIRSSCRATALPPLPTDDEDWSEAAGTQDDLSLRRVTRRNVLRTIKNVLVWSGASFALGFWLFPVFEKIAWALLAGTWAGVQPPLSDTAQGYVGNFFALISLLFSILAGNSYAALYSQNEAIFVALFAEVSEAKALMEQVSLVCSGRPFYRSALENIRRYVERDLRRLDRPPAVLCANKPRDDPLESILYLTSVGVPSAVYETVRSLRQRRGDRLGAVQRKLPPVQMGLLYVLGGMNLVSFLLLGSSVPNGELQLCRSLFGLMAAALMLTMRVIHELWNPVGGAYNVDGVLTVMIRGLEDELQQRLQGRTFSDTRLPPPPPRWKSSSPSSTAAAQT